MNISNLTYQVDNRKHISCLIYEDNNSLNLMGDDKRPGVMLVPAFEGMTDVYINMAKEYAKLGYAVFVVDLYGEGLVCKTFDECISNCMPHIENREMTRTKLLGAYSKFKSLDVVDPDNIAIFGFCLGGMCALDLARAGVDIKAAASVHGVLAAPDLPAKHKIKAKILVLHGYEDPQIPPDQLTGFANEMNAAGVDWQFHFYGNTKHAYTDPHAADIGPAEFGREYNALSAARSHREIRLFLSEVFAGH